jgi:hypothetical protein
MTKETLKQTLEALEKLVDSFADVSAYEDEEHAFTNELIFIPDIKKAIKAVAAAKQALAQPEQEPVLWMMPDGNTADKWALQFYGGQKGKPLYTTPPQENT